MPKIRLVKARKHLQIEFPDDLPHPDGRRGGRGSSLHLQRGTLRDVTPEELAFIEAEHPDVFACLQIFPEPVVSSRTRRRLAAAAAPPVPAKAPEKKPKRRKGAKSDK